MADGRHFEKKTVKSLYLCNRLTDLDKIWYSDSYWPLTADRPLLNLASYLLLLRCNERIRVFVCSRISRTTHHQTSPSSTLYVAVLVRVAPFPIKDLELVELSN